MIAQMCPKKENNNWTNTLNSSWIWPEFIEENNEVGNENSEFDIDMCNISKDKLSLSEKSELYIKMYKIGVYYIQGVTRFLGMCDKFRRHALLHIPWK